MNLRYRPESGRVLIIGHRGAEALAPENTWYSLKTAHEAGADLIELDVQLTRDGEAVLFHDFSLQPKLGDPRWLRDLAWDDLRALDVGRWFSPAFVGAQIPRFADVLDWARQEGAALWVDLKHGFVSADDDRLEMIALDLIEAADMADRVVISSWDQVALERILARRPDMPLAVNLRERVPDPVRQIGRTGARWVVVYWPQVDRQTVAQLQDAGLAVTLTNLFTEDYIEALNLGVNAVTATDPGAARAALEPTRLVQSPKLNRSGA